MVYSTSKGKNLPQQDSFTLQLTKTINGNPVIANANCNFSYNWDFQKNMGLAHLDKINNCAIGITLHPLGISGRLAFMSDMPPTNYVINGQQVTLFRVILDIEPATGIKSAAIMFNKNGSPIETTANWMTEDLALLNHSGQQKA